MTVPRRTHDECVTAALDVLARAGPGVPTRHSVVAAARILGVSRATVHRRWPAGSDLDVDLAVHMASTRPGWAQRVLHPALLGRSVTYDGHARGTLPSAIDAMFRSFTEPWDDETDGGDGPQTWAPNLPPVP